MSDTPNIDGPTLPAPRTRAPDARQAGFNLLRKLLIYHFTLAAGLLILFVAIPSLPGHLPIGGVEALAEGTGFTGSVPPPLPPPDRLAHARQLALSLVGIWLLMVPVSWVRRGVHRSSAYDHSLDKTTLILPGVVASIVLVVQYSLALAFALAGVVAGVQFRRALQDTFDALFILVAIGTGIAAGVGALEVAAMMTVFFCYATLYVGGFGDGFESDYLAERKESKRRLKAEYRQPDDEADREPP